MSSVTILNDESSSMDLENQTSTKTSFINDAKSSITGCSSGIFSFFYNNIFCCSRRGGNDKQKDEDVDSNSLGGENDESDLSKAAASVEQKDLPILSNDENDGIAKSPGAKLQEHDTSVTINFDISTPPSKTSAERRIRRSASPQKKSPQKHLSPVKRDAPSNNGSIPQQATRTMRSISTAFPDRPVVHNNEVNHSLEGYLLSPPYSLSSEEESLQQNQNVVPTYGTMHENRPYTGIDCNQSNRKIHTYTDPTGYTITIPSFDSSEIDESKFVKTPQLFVIPLPFNLNSLKSYNLNHDGKILCSGGSGGVTKELKVTAGIDCQNHDTRAVPNTVYQFNSKVDIYGVSAAQYQ